MQGFAMLKKGDLDKTTSLQGYVITEYHIISCQMLDIPLRCLPFPFTSHPQFSNVLATMAKLSKENPHSC